MHDSKKPTTDELADFEAGLEDNEIMVIRADENEPNRVVFYDADSQNEGRVIVANLDAFVPVTR